MSEAEDALARLWLPWALQVARNAFGGPRRCYGTEAEDRASDAQLALLEALRKFDRSRPGGNLKAFIAQRVKWRVIEGIRHRAGRTPRRRAMNVVACFQGTPACPDRRALLAWQEAERAEAAASARSALASAVIASEPNARVRKLLKLRRKGLTQGQAGARLGISASRANGLERDALSRLRERWQAGSGEG